MNDLGDKPLPFRDNLLASHQVEKALKKHWISPANKWEACGFRLDGTVDVLEYFDYIEFSVIAHRFHNNKKDGEDYVYFG